MYAIRSAVKLSTAVLPEAATLGCRGAGNLQLPSFRLEIRTRVLPSPKLLVGKQIKIILIKKLDSANFKILKFKNRSSIVGDELSHSPERRNRIERKPKEESSKNLASQTEEIW